MTPGYKLRPLSLVSLLLCLVAACSSGSSGGGNSNAITAATQDLTVDPDGTTTVLTFRKNLPTVLGPANFEADGGQLATGVVVAGNQATITWDARVTPTHRVRAVGVKGSSNAFFAVATSDASAPTYTITGATQNPGLGGDVITVQFAGPRVVEALAETLANWSVEVASTGLDLTGTTFDLDPATQILTITTGANANLHAAFNLAVSGLTSVADVAVGSGAVAGAATGDAVAPTLISAVQNLTADAFGRVVDFTFSEAMDPVFATQLSNFDAGFPTFATSVTQPTAGVLRVTFTAPVVPTVDTVNFNATVDAHGNPYAGGATAIAQGTTVVNAYDGNPDYATVANAGSDLLTIVTTQAFDPEDAVDPTHWTLDVDSTPVDLSTEVFAYDLLTRTLTITLTPDFQNGDAFTLTPLAPKDVDGDDFTSVFAGTVSGETTAPSVASITQNRTVDPTGRTLDVQFSEHVDQVQAEMTGNWSVTGLTVTGATRQAGLDIVRLTVDDAAVPGDATVTVTGVEDLAGNAIAAGPPLAVASTDSVAPAAASPRFEAVEGEDNDYVRVTFNDDMVESEVEDALNWTVESPDDNVLDTTGVTIDYDVVTRVAVLTFDGTTAVNFKALDDFGLTFNTMRDIGGNVVDPTELVGSITAENRFPTLDSVWVEAAALNEVHVRFDEPVEQLDDTFHAINNPDGRTAYALMDVSDPMNPLLRGTPTSVTLDSDGLGATLVFGIVVDTVNDRLDVSGVTDLAGNQMFPVSLLDIDAEDASEPDLDAATSLDITSGEDNDQISIVFDRPISSWGATDRSNYTLMLGATPVDLSQAAFAFDGTDTVTIDLDAVNSPNLADGSSYDLSVSGLLSAQGIAMTGTKMRSETAGGDAVAPTMPLGSVRLDAQDTVNSILIQMDEAIDPADAIDESLVEIASVDATTLVRLGPRSMRATFAGGVSAGQTVDVDLRDLAGNLASVSVAIQTEDTTAPLVTSVAGVATEGRGGDRITVQFDELVSPGLAVDPSNYVVTNGSNAVNIASATMAWDSATRTVTMNLAEGVELESASGITVTVSNMQDHAGNVIAAPIIVGGTTSGDVTAPDFDLAYVNRRHDPTGATLDLRFDEDVDELFAGDPLNYVMTGAEGVNSATVLSSKVVRLVLSGPYVTGDRIQVTGLVDLAGNASGAIETTPLE